MSFFRELKYLRRTLWTRAVGDYFSDRDNSPNPLNGSVRDRPRIPSSRPEHFRDAVANVRELGLDLQTLNGAEHPLNAWLAAAERLAVTLETRQFPGDPKATLEEDGELHEFVERTFIPATRLCRLAHSIRIAPRLGPAAKKEIRSLRLIDDFYHSEYVLHIAAKIMATCGIQAEVIDRGARSAPDLAFPSEQFCIECTARGNERGRSPRKELMPDFNHAGEKFAAYLPQHPGWLGVLAVDLGFVGSAPFPELGRAGPSLLQARADVESGFDEREEVAMFIGSMVAAASDRLGPGPTAGIELAPSEHSAWLYRPRCPRRITAGERTFIERPSAGTALTIGRWKED